MMFDVKRLSTESSAVEKIREYLFVAEMAQEAFFRFEREPLQISRPDVDNCGYDLVMEFRDVVRHIQLKGSKADAKAQRQNLARDLCRKPSGAVVWMRYDIKGEPRRFDLQEYWVFASPAGESLPDLGDKLAKHTKCDSMGIKKEREALRQVAASRFDRRFQNSEELFRFLFLRPTA